MSPRDKSKRFWQRLLGVPDASKLYMGTRIQMELPEIFAYLAFWERLARILRLIHVLLGTSATFFSLLAAAQIGSIQDEYAKLFAFIAALSIALMTGFNLGEKSNNVRNAWRELNAAVIAFNNGKLEEEEVIEAYRKGETRIGDVTFSRSS
jgi:Flp pilus assembly pilin Flp